MAGMLPAIRVIIQVVSTLILLASIGLVIGAVTTASWQWFHDPSTSETHLHGLWLDWNYAKEHAASYDQEMKWEFNYKFGQAVEHDASHRAQPYQINTLIVLCVGTLLAIIALFCSCCACVYAFAAVVWAISLIISAIICAIILLLFYVECKTPNQRYTSLNGRRLDVNIGDSYYMAIFGTVGYAISAVLAVICAVLTFLIIRSTRNNGRTYPHPGLRNKTHHMHITTSRTNTDV